MEEIRLGPIEWGVVTAHYRWGLGVRLEESGDEGVIVLSSIHDDPRHCDSEYWPDIGERIRVRRYLYRSPNDEVRLTSCESAMEGLVNGYDPPRKYPPPEGFGPAQEGTVIAHCDWGVEVRLDSGRSPDWLDAIPYYCRCTCAPGCARRSRASTPRCSAGSRREWSPGR